MRSSPGWILAMERRQGIIGSDSPKQRWGSKMLEHRQRLDGEAWRGGLSRIGQPGLGVAPRSNVAFASLASDGGGR